MDVFTNPIVGISHSAHVCPISTLYTLIPHNCICQVHVNKASNREPRMRTTAGIHPLDTHSQHQLTQLPKSRSLLSVSLVTQAALSPPPEHQYPSTQ